MNLLVPRINLLDAYIYQYETCQAASSILFCYQRIIEITVKK